MQAILPGVEWIGGNSAGNYTGGGWKLLLHTTEGKTLAGAVAAYRANNSWPHLTVSPKERRKAQHVRFPVAARALRNTPGGVETNRSRVIQVEIVGFAGQMPAYFTDGEWVWLRTVIDSIFAACPEIGRRAVDGFHAYPPPMSLGKEPWRMSGPDWVKFSGVVGHQHAPENYHGDPGAIPIHQLLGDQSPPPPPGAPGTSRRHKMDICTSPDGRVTSVVVGGDGKAYWAQAADRDQLAGAGYSVIGGNLVSVSAAWNGAGDILVVTGQGPDNGLWITEWHQADGQWRPWIKQTQVTLLA
jgi:hypothetical protein